jgi:FlaA1/EpsC-like NDP-sugar epimerase
MINGERFSKFKQHRLKICWIEFSINIRNSKNFDEAKNKVVLVTGGAGSIGSEQASNLYSMITKSLIVIDQITAYMIYNKNLKNRNGYHNFLPIAGECR